MTRLYTEADVRAMLVSAYLEGERDTALDSWAPDTIADRVLRPAAPVAQPDPMRMAPVQPTKGVPFPTSVPWHIYLRAHSQYEAFGQRQSAERLAERGGFDTEELVTLLCGRDPYNHGHKPPSAEEVERCRRDCEPQPDLSRLAEAVREAAAFKLDQARHEPGRTLYESQAFDVARAIIRSLDLAPIIAGTGLVGEPSEERAAECERIADAIDGPGGWLIKKDVPAWLRARAIGLRTPRKEQR